LTLATAAESPDPDSPGPTEIDRKLGKLIRSPDGALSLKAIEVRERIEERRRQASRSDEPTDPIELFRQLIVCMPVLGIPLAVGNWVGADFLLLQFPFLNLVAPYLAKHFPEDWKSWRGRPDPGLTAVVEAEAGPVLTAEAIVAAVTAPVLLKRNGAWLEQQEAASAA
jgi:hypothetical protein